MPKSPVKLRQADMARALKAAALSGMAISKITADPATGKIEFFIGGPQSDIDPSPFDAWVAKKNAG